MFVERKLHILQYDSFYRATLSWSAVRISSFAFVGGKFTKSLTDTVHRTLCIGILKILRKQTQQWLCNKLIVTIPRNLNIVAILITLWNIVNHNTFQVVFCAGWWQTFCLLATKYLQRPHRRTPWMTECTELQQPTTKTSRQNACAHD